MKIVFMGTPEFAESSLAALLSSRHQVIGVFTQPDKPKGRGYKLVPPPVKELAMAHSIPVYQPQKMRDGEALSILQELQPDLIAVVEDGRVTAQLPLPVAGLMSEAPLPQVNAALSAARAQAQRQGVNPGIDPFMTLSFMSLPVIPTLRLLTRGAFHVEKWQYVE